jgi:ABC-type transport system substrate-binding protein
MRLVAATAVTLVLLWSGGAPVHAVGTSQAKINTYPKHGTVLYSDWQFPDTLNPLQTSIGVSGETFNTMFAFLAVFDAKGHLKPDLLTTIPNTKNHQILNGGRTVVLTLKPHQYWSSGVEITNRDVWFGWKMYMDPATGPACLGTCDQIASITLQGRYTAILHLKAQYAPILSLGLPPVWPHSWGRLGLTPHAAATTLGKDKTFNFEDATYWTDGPYQVQSYVNNDRIVLRPMKYYHVHPGPYVARLIFSFYASKDGLIAAAANGQTDVTTDYTLADVPTLQQHKNAFKTMITPAFLIENLQINQYSATYNGKPNPLRDVRVRQAMALALDKVGIVRSALGVNTQTARNAVAYTPFVVTPTYVQPYADTSIKGAWDPYLKKYVPFGARALADARKLMAAAGYANGFDLDFITTAGNAVRAAEYSVIANNWARIGIKTSLTTAPPNKMFADWNAGGIIPHEQFQIGMWSIGTSPDPDSLKIMISSHFLDADKTNHSTIYQDWSGIRDTIVDQGMDKAAATFNKTVRARLYKEVQQRLAKNADWIQIYYRPDIVTADTRVTGVTAPPFFDDQTWNIYTWHLVR